MSAVEQHVPVHQAWSQGRAASDLCLGPVVDRALKMLAEHVQNGELVVPPDNYFAMGDNRDNSLDSRYWNFLPLTYVKGRAMTIYFSYDPDATGAASLLTSIRWGRLFRQVH